MTSQGMILTKRNVIFVSDKQETMADGKTYGGADKIFELSKLHSAALMTNGNADFENVPIETLITEFKFHTNFKKLSTIDEIKDKFIEFLSKSTGFSSIEKFIKEVLVDFKEGLISDISEYGFNRIIKIKQKREIISFIKCFSNFDNEFYDIIPDYEDKPKCNKIIWEIFSYNLQYVGTGVIIAGFNYKCHYPSFIELNIYCNDCGNIIYEVIDSAFDCCNPFIKVFAINEEAYTFITGVGDDFIEYILNYVFDANHSFFSNFKWSLGKEEVENVDGIVNIAVDTLNKEYSKMLDDISIFRGNALNYTSYSIEFLPEWLLCIFADLLIRLTAVKQKTTSDIESVSISTDILIMSKLKGFEYIKNDERIF